MAGASSVVVAAGLFFAPAAAGAAESDVGRLAWLAGCWSAEGAEPGSGEQWMPLAGGSLKRIEFPMARVSCDAQRAAPEAK